MSPAESHRVRETLSDAKLETVTHLAEPVLDLGGLCEQVATCRLVEGVVWRRRLLKSRLQAARGGKRGRLAAVDLIRRQQICQSTNVLGVRGKPTGRPTRWAGSGTPSSGM
eukprot:scaffold64632_cov31-Tisochrysis_lutea.AAC.2